MTARDKGRQQRCRLIITNNKLMLKRNTFLSPFFQFISSFLAYFINSDLDNVYFLSPFVLVV